MKKGISFIEFILILTTAIISILVVTSFTGTRLQDITAGLTGKTVDFSIDATPASQINIQLQTSVYTVNVNPIVKSGQNVKLSITGCPPSAICSLTPQEGSTPFQSYLSVRTTPFTPGGRYKITTTGSGPSGISSAVVELIVLQQI